MTDDHITDAQFRRMVEIIEGQVGIKLPPSKRTMVESRLRKRVRALGLPHLAAYGLGYLESGRVPPDELVHLIDCVTTNKTDFFREPTHFELLRDRIVPEILTRRSGRDKPLKVWSAACSTGAEPYTIAMVMAEMARDTRFRFDILGTDISTEVLAKARRGVFPADMAEPIPPTWRARYLMTPRDRSRGDVRIVPELRAGLRLARLNLMDASYPVDADMDVIFCRNVLIYFEREVQQQVLRRLCSHLRPGGYHFLGHSESMAANQGLDMQQVLPTVYQSGERRPVQRTAA